MFKSIPFRLVISGPHWPCVTIMQPFLYHIQRDIPITSVLDGDFVIYLPAPFTRPKVIPRHTIFKLHLEPDTVEFNVTSQILYGTFVFVSFEGMADSIRNNLSEVARGITFFTFVSLSSMKTNRFPATFLAS